MDAADDGAIAVPDSAMALKVLATNTIHTRTDTSKTVFLAGNLFISKLLSLEGTNLCMITRPLILNSNQNTT
jgi:hypothetical protein